LFLKLCNFPYPIIFLIYSPPFSSIAIACKHPCPSFCSKWSRCGEFAPFGDNSARSSESLPLIQKHCCGIGCCPQQL
jgi:hypothetical protein